MGIQSGKISVIYDNDPRLSDVWKGRPAGEDVKMDPLVGNGGDEGSDGPATPNRPCLLYTSPSPRDRQKSRMPSSA